MTGRNFTADAPETVDGARLVPLPTPPLNLHNLDAVRREMSRVYRDMRGRRIDSQDGTRLVYVLSQIAKVHEIAELEKKIEAIEARDKERTWR